jgi:hypothetical protein
MSFLGKNGKLAGTFLALASTILVFNVSPAFAFSQGDLVSGGSVWLETTIAVALVFVTAMAFSLQIARGYFLRTLEKFTLRLGADIWWLTYVLLRDGLIFASFITGLMVFFPGTLGDYAIAVPFMPVSVVLFGAALILKLYFDADEDRNIFRVVTGLVFGGAASWIFGTIFITETPLALAPNNLPSSISTTSGFWYTLANTFNSQTNPDLYMASFYVCFTALGIFGVLGLAHPILHSRVGKGVKRVAQQTQGPVTPSSFPTRMSVRSSDAGREATRSPIGSLQASTASPQDKVDYIQ